MKATAFAALLAASLVVGCEKTPPATPTQEPTPSIQRPDAGAPKAEQPLQATDAGKALETIEREIAFYTKQARAKSGWIHLERVVGGQLALARLTGNVDHYIAAEKTLEEAFAMAKEGAGPFMMRAQLNYTIHRNAEVEADLARQEKSLLQKDSDKAQVAAMRGDLAFHRAELDAARKLYNDALGHKRDSATVGRLAFLDLKTGAVDAARRGYEEVAEMADNDKVQRSWALLHRGIVELEIGNVKEALAWYEKADEAFTGWYLVEEHVAEAKLLLGDPDAAIELYESIVARTPSGEFMAALAESWAAKGDAEREKAWMVKAAEAFERDIAKLPSAASGHALEFYLGYDPKRALELARQNFELRPNHDAHMLLAQAHLASGSPANARDALAPVVGSSWASPDFLATVAVAFEGADEEISKSAEAAAAKIDPEAVAGLREALGLSAPAN